MGRALAYDRVSRHCVVPWALKGAGIDPAGLAILDVGGAEGSLREFLPGSLVTVLEPVPMGPGSVAGDAASLPFGDGSFPVVTMLDVLEHLPPERRPTAIREAARVASRLVVGTVPVGSPEVRAAEREVARLRQSPAVREFLREHLEHGTPEESAVREWLAPWDGRFWLRPWTPLGRWLEEQLVEEACAGLHRGEDLIEVIAALGSAVEETAPAQPYRLAFVIATGPEVAWRPDDSPPPVSRLNAARIAELADHAANALDAGLSWRERQARHLQELEAAIQRKDVALAQAKAAYDETVADRDAVKAENRRAAGEYAALERLLVETRQAYAQLESGYEALSASHEEQRAGFTRLEAYARHVETALAARTTELEQAQTTLTELREHPLRFVVQWNMERLRKAAGKGDPSPKE